MSIAIRKTSISAAKPTADDRDASGLPVWRLTEDGYIAGPDAQTFGIACLFHGFNLPEFDIWLSGLRDCGAKVELLERREKARVCMFQNNTDGALRHLEWMLLRWNDIRREDFLLPLARTGDKVRKPFGDANAARRGDAETQQQRWQALAELKWADPLHKDKSASDIARLIAQPGEKPDTIRRKIKKPS